MKETVTILVKAAPTWSTKYKEYEVCTAGVTPEGAWRRLYPFPEDVFHDENIKLWDIINIETSVPSNDIRSESRKIDYTMIENIGRINTREEKRRLLDDITESSLQDSLNSKRSLCLVKPNIVSFAVEPNRDPMVQFTLDGKPFIKNPYADVDLIYRWTCEDSCEFCEGQPHRMKCFDWGAHVLYKRYPDPVEAVEKVTDMCLTRMRDEFDTWFVLGTHSQRPFRRWMIVGLLWMKKN